MYKKTFDFESSKAVILNYFQNDKKNLSFVVESFSANLKIGTDEVKIPS